MKLSRIPLACLLLSALACGGDMGPQATEATIPAETFIDVYVDLRLAAIQRGSEVLDTLEARRILEEHGVTRQDLLDFADAYGGDFVFMNGVWEEIQARLDSVTVEAIGAPQRGR